MNKLPEIVFALTVACIVGILCLSGFGCHHKTSDGERVGVVTKLSRKGVVVKTWEGEAIIGSSDVPGVGTVWQFTVDDAGPLKDVEEAIASGKKVHLRYIEYLSSGVLNGDTNYRVTGVRK